MIKREHHPLSVIIIFLTLMIQSLLFSNLFYIISIFIIMVFSLCLIEGFRVLRSIIFIVTFFFLISLFVNILFTNNGTTILIQINNIPLIKYKRISLEQLIFTFTASLRLVYIILVFRLINHISNEDSMMSFFSKILRNFPFLISFSIRLIPKFKDDYERLEHIFKLRGLDIYTHKSNEKTGLIRKFKNKFNPRLLKILLRTMLMNSLDDSMKYAEAMRARGYGSSERRSVYYNYYFRLTDVLSILLSLFLISVSVVIVLMNIGVVPIYPAFVIDKFIEIEEIAGLIILSFLNIVLFYI